ncbi:MAG TPA: hypothetical protein VHB79_26940 [Polyangiaceae bacterium]|nr:hypothetical protein [Polyangiaceae bacterium]
MAKCFTSWTVLAHEPIEKHSENLWSVSGKMPGGNQRRMTVARRADGKLVIHNAIALGDAEMKEIESLGEPGYLIVPNGFHRMDSVIYKQRYPKLNVLAPASARKKVAQLVEVAGHLDEMPKDDAVELFHLRGMKQNEGALRVKSASGVGVVFNDTLLNMEPTGGIGGLAMGPTGTLSVPRFMRWVMMKNGAELKEHLNELAGSAGLSHVVPGHGDVIAKDASQRLQQAAARL